MVCGQTSAVPALSADSVKSEIVLPDTTITLIEGGSAETSLDSLISDTAKTKKTAELDTIITYSADSIYFGVEKRYTILQGQSKVKYQDMELTAGIIIVDWDNDKLTAMPLPDTTWGDSVAYTYDSVNVTLYDTVKQAHYDTVMVLPADSTITVYIDTVIIREYPVFRQRGDEMVGDTMYYNIKSKKGFIVQGKTDYSDGYYYGQDIKKVSEKVMNVGEGDYTTCELDTPHYHFHSKKMKLVVKDKVIAKPVVLYFKRVPILLMAPFGIFPAKTGRQTGLIVPHYGETGSQGRFLKGLGYYVAESSYWDARMILDFYERSGVVLDGDIRYKKLYRLDGRVTGSFTRLKTGSGMQKRWDLIMLHNQTLTPTAKLMVNAKYVSDGSYYQDLSSNPEDRMQRIIRSDATFRDSYKALGGNLSVNVHHEQNLDDETAKTTIPQLSFNLGQKSFFPEKEDQEDLYWYNKIYWSANSRLTNKQEKKRTTEYIQVTVQDTVTGLDSTYTETVYDYYWEKQGMLKNGYSLSSSQTVLKYFNINPGLSIAQDVTDYSSEYYLDEGTQTILSRKEEGYYARHTFGFSTGLNTKLYGTFPADFWGVTSFRHVMTPSVTYNLAPDFSKRGWGYYQYVEDANGIEQKKDRFLGQMIGGTPATETQSMNFNLNNLFQMKREVGEGEEREAQKTDLFSVNFATGHNFAAQQFKWSVFTSSLRADPIKSQNIGPLAGLTFDVTTAHDFYTTNEFGAKIDKFFYEDEENWKKGKLLRLTSLTFNANFRFTPPKKEKAEKEKTEVVIPETMAVEDSVLADENAALYVPPIQSSDRFRRDFDFKPAEIPWDMNTSFYFNWSHPNPNIEAAKTIWLQNSLNLKLTENWSISYTNRVDLVTHQIVESGFTFYRDLHCWEGRLMWNPGGVGQGFFVKINVKSASLRDLKLEKRKGAGGFLGY